MTTHAHSPLRLFHVLMLAVIAGLALTLTACGGGGGGGVSNPPPGSNPLPAGMAAVKVQMGDAPVDSVVAFEITVNSIVLTDMNNNNVEVLSAPRRIELSHNSATLEPLAALQVPQGTYTKATITVSNPEVAVVNGSGQVVELAVSLASPTATVPFNPQITVGTTASSINFDFNLAASLAINGNTATVTPAFTAGAAQVVAEAEQEEENGEIEDLTGQVTAVNAPNFTIAVGQSAVPMIFATDANTQFEGVAGVGGLQQGMVIQVEGFTLADGTAMAKKVEVEEAEAEGLEAEGIVTSIAGMPNSFQMVVQDESSPSNAVPNVGTTINVNVDASTHYRIQSSNNIDLNGLPFTPAFDATTLAPAQNVEADTSTSNPTSITADSVKLQNQAITGVVSNATPIDGSHTSFTLTPAADSVFHNLSGKTSLSVITTGATNFNGVNAVNNGATLRIRGLLFFQGGSYRMVASRVTTP